MVEASDFLNKGSKIGLVTAILLAILGKILSASFNSGFNSAVPDTIFNLLFLPQILTGFYVGLELGLDGLIGDLIVLTVHVIWFVFLGSAVYWIFTEFDIERN